MPAWLYNLSLLTREGVTVLEALAYCVPPLPGKVIKPLLSFSSITLSPHFYLALVHREPRFWQRKWGLRRDEFLLTKVSYDLGPLNLDGKKITFFISIISVGNKLPSLPEKWAIFRSFDDYCNMLKYCLYLSLPQKYEIIRSATRSKYFMCFWENPHVTLS